MYRKEETLFLRVRHLLDHRNRKEERTEPQFDQIQREKEIKKKRLLYSRTLCIVGLPALIVRFCSDFSSLEKLKGSTHNVKKTRES